MISGALRFQGFDQRSWTNLISLFAPGVAERRQHDGEARPAGTLLVVVDSERRVMTALHSLRGRVPVAEVALDGDLPRLREQHRAHRVVVLREGTLEEIAERLALRLSRDDDYATQWLTLGRCFRELVDAGAIEVSPNPWRAVPVPSPATARRALDIVLPDGKAFAFALWHRGELWTAAALRRRGGDIDEVAGPDLIRRWTGPLGGDWRRDYRVVADAVSRSVAPLQLGLFAEMGTVRDLLRYPDAGAWATAIGVRDVIVHPMPAYVGVALGADVVNAVARTGAQLLGGVDLLGALTPVRSFLRAQVGQIASVSDTLGFNPLEVLGRSLRREDMAPEDE